MYQLVLFDMDGTLLQGRTIFQFAEKKGFIKQLTGFIDSTMEPFEKTIEIAKLLKGYEKHELLSLFHEIPLRPGVEELIDSFKKRGMIIALATDSYRFVADDMKDRLGIDYTFANNLLFHDSICTGEVVLHNNRYEKDEITQRIYSISKSTILKNLCDTHGISIEESIAIGDGLVDCCMLHKAGLGVAVFANDEVNRCANRITNDLLEILSYIDR